MSETALPTIRDEQMPPAEGLTSAEAARRKAQGRANDAPMPTSRPLSAILRANLLSVTNVILFGIMVVLVLIGEAGDALVTGGVVFINVAISMVQELRAKRQLDRIALLTRPRVAVIRDGQERQVDPAEIVTGDLLSVKPGDQIVVDGRLASGQRIDVDESLLTGESAHVAKEPGDPVLSGSFCVRGSGQYVAEKVGRESFAYQLTAGAREYRRTLTPLQRQVSILVRLLVILAIGLATLLFLSYAIEQQTFTESVKSAAVVISLVPQGLLLMITVAYALGALRIAQKGALVQQINAVESLSNVDVLCLDKTGTLTTNRIALHEAVPIGISESDLARLAGDFAASTGRVNRTAEALANAFPGQAQPATIEIPFASAYKWSGAAFDGEGSLRGSYVMGAPEMLVPHIQDGDALAEQAAAWTAEGMRVLIFAHHDQPLQPPRDSEAPALPAGLRPLGWLIFSDELRPDARQVLDQFRQAGITLKLISGDNPQTVAALARMAGISPDAEVISGLDLAALPEGEFDLAVEQTTVFGRITPEQKQRIVQTLRAQGHYVAMIGDGVNDVLSLKQAQMGIAMESGSQATRAVADLVLLGDRFSILPETIKEGQRILNGMQDVMRLFLTRTLYAALLIIIAGIIGTEFPFTPRHNAILTTLPVGLPAVVLTQWARSGRPQQNLFASIAGFVLPAGFSITVTTLVVYLLYLDEPVQLQRTVLTTTALLCSLLIIIFAGHSVADWESGRRLSPSRRRIALALTMLAAYLVIFAIPPLREFFELNTLSWENLFVVALAVAIWAVVVRVLWRYDVFERILVPAE